jgi:tetratricopeptide (TPR) repeat protein
MSPDEEHSLRLDLEAIDREMLLAIADFLKFKVPADIDKPDLVDRLLKNYPTDLTRYLRTVRHVELLRTQQSLPEEVRLGFRRLVGSLEFLRTAAGLIIGLASAVAGIAAYAGFQNYFDLQQAIKTQQKVNATQKRLAIEQAWEASEAVLRRMTLAQPVEPRLAELLQRQIDLLNDARQWADGSISPDLSSVADILTQALRATLSLKGLEISTATTLDDLTTADNRWREVMRMIDDGPATTAFAGMTRRIKGYALNSLGIIALLRYERNLADQQLLEEASKDFREAEQALPGFARVVSNRGVTLAKSCDSKGAAADRCLVAAGNEYTRAFTYTDSPAELVTLYNNLAMIDLRRARLKVAQQAYSDADTFLGAAERNVMMAENQPANASVAFGTHSQISALRIASRFRRKLNVEPEAREALGRQLAQVVGLSRVTGAPGGSCGDFLSKELFGEADFVELKNAAPKDFLPALSIVVCRS